MDDSWSLVDDPLIGIRACAKPRFPFFTLAFRVAGLAFFDRCADLGTLGSSDSTSLGLEAADPNVTVS
jgi:hypothetical protein